MPFYRKYAVQHSVADELLNDGPTWICICPVNCSFIVATFAFDRKEQIDAQITNSCAAQLQLFEVEYG